jgi:hypothetical protein
MLSAKHEHAKAAYCRDPGRESLGNPESGKTEQLRGRWFIGAGEAGGKAQFPMTNVQRSSKNQTANMRLPWSVRRGGACAPRERQRRRPAQVFNGRFMKPKFVFSRLISALFAFWWGGTWIWDWRRDAKRAGLEQGVQEAGKKSRLPAFARGTPTPWGAKRNGEPGLRRIGEGMERAKLRKKRWKSQNS